MAAEPLAVGIVGAGAAAKLHARALQAESRAHLSTVWSHRAESTGRFAGDFGLAPSRSYEELLGKVDAVYICSPNVTHVPLARLALQHGKHVYCEKPMGLASEEVRALHELSLKSPTTFQLGYNRRFAPVYVAMAEAMRRAPITSFNMRINRGELEAPAWVADHATSGGFLFETTIHLLDLVQFFCGKITRCDVARTQRHYPTDDNFSMLIETESGAHGVLSSCAHASWCFPFERVELFSWKATARSEEFDTLDTQSEDHGPTLQRRFDRLPTEEKWGFTASTKAFFDGIAGQARGAASTADGLATTLLVEQIQRARAQ